MMARYCSRQELANKIDWEGGIFDMLFGYGLTIDDLPEDDTELIEAFAEVEAFVDKLGSRVAKFTALLPEPRDDDE